MLTITPIALRFDNQRRWLSLLGLCATLVLVACDRQKRSLADEGSVSAQSTELQKCIEFRFLDGSTSQFTLQRKQLSFPGMRSIDVGRPVSLGEAKRTDFEVSRDGSLVIKRLADGMVELYPDFRSVQQGDGIDLENVAFFWQPYSSFVGAARRADNSFRSLYVLSKDRLSVKWYDNLSSKLMYIDCCREADFVVFKGYESAVVVLDLRNGVFAAWGQRGKFYTRDGVNPVAVHEGETISVYLREDNENKVDREEIDGGTEIRISRGVDGQIVISEEKRSRPQLIVSLTNWNEAWTIEWDGGWVYAVPIGAGAERRRRIQSLTPAGLTGRVRAVQTWPDVGLLRVFWSEFPSSYEAWYHFDGKSFQKVDLPSDIQTKVRDGYSTRWWCVPCFGREPGGDGAPGERD